MTTPSGVSLSKITLGGTTVTKTGHYTYSAGTLTLKSALLTVQDNGACAFVLNMSNGDTATVTVTVGA